MVFTRILQQRIRILCLREIPIGMRRDLQSCMRWPQEQPFRNTRPIQKMPSIVAKQQADPATLPLSRVIVATNAAETAVTFQRCWLCIDTCVVNQMMYDASLRAKAQQTVPCSQAASRQRGGRARRHTPGIFLRLVTHLEWNNMPPKDPSQPHMNDETALCLRLASESLCWTPRE